MGEESVMRSVRSREPWLRPEAKWERNVELEFEMRRAVIREALRPLEGSVHTRKDLLSRPVQRRGLSPELDRLNRFPF